MKYDMSSFILQCLENYANLAGIYVDDIRPACTPFLDESTFQEPREATPDSPKGARLASVALKSLMKVLYAARMCRFDVLRATCVLARRVSTWDRDCDRRLHRLMCYLKHTQTMVNIGFCGDKFSACRVALFADADFAGCKSTAKSTSGNFLAIVGPILTCRSPLYPRSKDVFH